MKRTLAVLLILLLSVSLFACNNDAEKAGVDQPEESAETTDDEQDNEPKEEAKDEKFELKLAHNLAEDHPLHLAVVQFAEDVKEGTNGNVTVEIYPNAMLGTEREVMEQLQNGAVDITRIGSASLENFSDIFSAFTVPYIFRDEQHFYDFMTSEEVETIYQASVKDGLMGLTFYDGGARSFYTKETPIETPEDLKGLKIRVMDNPSSIKMMEVLGASATPMAYGDIYTALQQGVLDGAENNPTALTLGKHGEVAKFYSFDEHTRIPDFMIISTATWEKLPEEYQKVIKDAAAESTKYHTKLWKEAVDKAVQEAQDDYGVTISYPDKKPFQDAVQPIYESLKDKPEVYDLVQKIINFE